MSILASSNIRFYLNVVELVDVDVSMGLYTAETLDVYYGNAGILAINNVDYEIVLNEVDYSNFVFRPFESLIDKIDALIASDVTEQNVVLLSRILPLETDAEPASARSSQFVANEFTRIAMQFQQLQSQLDRAFVMSQQAVLDPLAVIELPWPPPEDGVPAYDLANNTFKWATLQGGVGPAGPAGPAGAPGTPGTNGTNGIDGGIGNPIATLDTATGLPATVIASSLALGGKKHLLILYEGVSHSSGSNQNIRIELSNDNGSSWGNQHVRVSGAAGGDALYGADYIYHAGENAVTKVLDGGAGTNGNGKSNRINVESTKNGIIDAIRFSPAGGTFDGGRILIYAFN